MDNVEFTLLPDLSVIPCSDDESSFLHHRESRDDSLPRPTRSLQDPQPTTSRQPNPKGVNFKRFFELKKVDKKKKKLIFNVNDNVELTLLPSISVVPCSDEENSFYNPRESQHEGMTGRTRYIPSPIPGWDELDDISRIEYPHEPQPTTSQQLNPKDVNFKRIGEFSNVCQQNRELVHNINNNVELTLLTSISVVPCSDDESSFYNHAELVKNLNATDAVSSAVNFEVNHAPASFNFIISNRGSNVLPQNNDKFNEDMDTNSSDEKPEERDLNIDTPANYVAEILRMENQEMEDSNEHPSSSQAFQKQVESTINSIPVQKSRNPAQNIIHPTQNPRRKPKRPVAVKLPKRFTKDQESVFKKDRVKKHLNVIDPRDNLILKNECYLCHMKFLFPHRLKDHMISHENVKEFECEVCGKKYKYKRGLKAHLHTHKKPSRFGCYFCKIIPISAAGLERHLRTHTNEQPFRCKVCGNKYKYNNGLNAHLNTHKKQHRFGCYFCDIIPVSAAGLERHLRTHTNEQPFKCEVCGKTYNTKDSLSTHLKRRIVNLRFRCSLCNKFCTSQSQFQSHLKSHNSNGLFKCEDCGNTFTRKYNMQQHMKKRHLNSSSSSQKQVTSNKTKNFKVKRKVNLKARVILPKNL